MKTDFRADLWHMLGGAAASYKTLSVPPLRDEGQDLQSHLAGNVFHIQQAAPAEVEATHAVDRRDPAALYCRLAWMDEGGPLAIVFRLQRSRVAAFNLGSDAFHGSVRDHLLSYNFTIIDPEYPA
jgi:hypothetical protein